MAKNQRQRRPLQDDTRTAKQTVRERAQVSKRQRDRIEENRDRREQRRERQRARRQIVDSVRSPKEDVRIERMDSRIVPIEDTFLGRPVGSPRELPVLVGERWDMTTGSQTINSGSFTDVALDTAVFTTERNGYPALYSTSIDQFTIPGGLSGIWWGTFFGNFNIGVNTGEARWLLNGATVIAYFETGGTAVASENVNTSFQRYLYEGDTLQIQVFQNSGAGVSLLSSPGFTHCSLIFLGK